MKIIQTIDEYVSQCPLDRQEILIHVRNLIKECLPDATECIKYGMPTYFQKANVVHFANAKNHLGFYPTPSAITAFEKQLKRYKTSKGAIQFPFAEPIPYALIREITLWRKQQLQKTESSSN